MVIFMKKNSKHFLEEYRQCWESVRHNEKLMWVIITFYFGIVGIFLKFGYDNLNVIGLMLLLNIFFGFSSAFVFFRVRKHWIDDLERAKDIEKLFGFKRLENYKKPGIKSASTWIFIVMVISIIRWVILILIEK